MSISTLFPPFTIPAFEGNVSLKLTQFGLDFSYDQCRANVEQLVRRAAALE